MYSSLVTTFLTVFLQYLLQYLAYDFTANHSNPARMFIHIHHMDEDQKAIKVIYLELQCE